MRPPVGVFFTIVCLGLLPSNCLAWRSSIETDPLSDQKIGVSSTTSRSGRSQFDKPYQAIVRCKEGEPIDIFFVWHDFLNDDGIRVEYRFDDAPMNSATMKPSTDGDTTFVPESNVDKFLNMMKERNVLQVKAYDFRGTPTELATFSLIGFTKQFTRACGWYQEAAQRRESYRELAEIRSFQRLSRQDQQKRLAEYEECLNAPVSYSREKRKAYCTKAHGYGTAQAFEKR